MMKSVFVAAAIVGLSLVPAKAAGIVTDDAVIGAAAMLVAHAKCGSLTEAGMVRVINISKLATEKQMNNASAFVAKQFNDVGKDVFCALTRGAANAGTFK